MISRRVIFAGLFIVLVHICVVSVSAQSGNNSTNASSVTTASTTTTTTTVRSNTTTIMSTTAPTPAKNVTAEDDEDCVDEPEAEGPAKNGTAGDRQGKGLVIISDKDKYTHENGTAEPEAESEPGTNSTLTGNRTASSSSDARGTASSLTSTCNFATYVLGISVASLLHNVRP